MEKNIITSVENNKIRELKKLGDKKERDTSGCFVVENFKIIYDALSSGFKPESVFIDEELLKKKDQKLESVIKEVGDYFIINKKVNKYFSSLSTPSGICAVFKKVERGVNLKEKIVYLNGINDPGNLGTIIRTALAFDFLNIVIDDKCVDLYNYKTIAAAKDSVFKVNISFDQKRRLLKKIKEKMKICSTDLGGNSTFNEITREDKYCLVFGNEANGVDDDIKKISDFLVKISISDKIESLNVAISAGIILHKLSLIK